jgi:kynurenine aminotransferase
VFTVNSPLQEATAVAFEKVAEEKFFETQKEEYIQRRAVLAEALDRLGLP